MYAVDMLGTLGVPEDLIEQVRGMLDSRADELEGAKPSPIGAVFGGSAQGQLLTHHAGLARQHVAEAVLQMAAGLRGYGSELEQHRVRMGDTDVQNGVDLTRIEIATTCVAAPTLESNQQCTLPTSEDGGA